jgi:hypothetical protein
MSLIIIIFYFLKKEKQHLQIKDKTVGIKIRNKEFGIRN